MKMPASWCAWCEKPVLPLTCPTRGEGDLHRLPTGLEGIARPWRDSGGVPAARPADKWVNFHTLCNLVFIYCLSQCLFCCCWLKLNLYTAADFYSSFWWENAVLCKIWLRDKVKNICLRKMYSTKGGLLQIVLKEKAWRGLQHSLKKIFLRVDAFKLFWRE